MLFFNKSGDSLRCAALVDIGSASVLGSIIVSNDEMAHPEIIWSKREHSAIKDVSSVAESAKNVMSALMNVMLELEKNGRKALREKYPKVKIDDFQVSISAPWSYTVTKTLSHNKPEGIVISQELVDDLLKSAEEKVIQELRENEISAELGLEITARLTTGIYANGYKLVAINNQKTNNLTVSHSSVITQAYLAKAIKEARDKVLRKSDLQIYSFMLSFFCVSRDLFPSLTDVCLVDVTYEATEIAIVRDGILKYCTHTPFGAYSIAREISAVTKIPLGEAYGHLTGPGISNLMKNRPPTQAEEIKKIISAYQKKLEDLFSETGDSLTIPKTLLLHSNLYTESFFHDCLLEAGKKVTGSNHIVSDVTKQLLSFPNLEKDKKTFVPNFDSALLVSAQFYHDHCPCD